MAEKLLPSKERWISWLPGMLGGWTQARDLQEMPKETFRDWWEKRHTDGD
jgi:L-lactate dehydrogenase complex protein LldF